VAGCLLELSPEKVFCIGLVHETPVFLDRADGNVLGVPDQYGEWADAEYFELLTPGVEAFFLERLATPEYARLALVDDELVKYDDWLKLLRRAGITG
jgi:hypothetical protein